MRIAGWLQALPANIWLAVFFIVPLISILWLSLTTGNSIEGFD